MVCFACKYDALSFTGASRDIKFEDVLGLDDFFALAFFAAVLFGNDFSGCFAVAAGDSFLGYKARADLSEDGFRTCGL